MTSSDDAARLRIGTSGRVPCGEIARVLGAEVSLVEPSDYARMLVAGDIDAYVSWYDAIPPSMDERLTVAAVLRREDPHFVCCPIPLEDIPDGSVVAVGSDVVRRILSEDRPGIVQMEGGLSEVEGGLAVAAILPSVNVPDGMVFHRLDPEIYVHTPSQGAIAVVCRKNDDRVSAVRSLNHMPTRTAVEAERGVMNLLGAIPEAPLGVSAEVVEDCIRVVAVSYCYTDEARRADEYIPIDYVMDEILGIVEYLAGKRDEIIRSGSEHLNADRHELAGKAEVVHLRIPPLQGGQDGLPSYDRQPLVHDHIDLLRLGQVDVEVGGQLLREGNRGVCHGVPVEDDYLGIGLRSPELRLHAVRQTFDLIPKSGEDDHLGVAHEFPDALLRIGLVGAQIYHAGSICISG